MKKRFLILIVLVLAVIAGAYYFLAVKPQPSPGKEPANSKSYGDVFNHEAHH